LKNKDKADEIFNAIAAKEKHFKIYKKADIPEKLHFNTNARIGDMLLVVEPGYGFYNKESLAKKPENVKFGAYTDSTQQLVQKWERFSMLTVQISRKE
jgi:hypothetical protein